LGGRNPWPDAGRRAVAFVAGGGDPALIDWDEARIGDVRLDLGFARDAAGRAAHAAAEMVACWRAEPARGRMMARRLRLIVT